MEKQVDSRVDNQANNRVNSHVNNHINSYINNQVEGTVVDVANRGRGYDHVIACGEVMLSAVFVAEARPRGSRVRLALDPDGCIAFPLTDQANQRYDEKVTTVTAAKAATFTPRQGETA